MMLAAGVETDWIKLLFPAIVIVLAVIWPIIQRITKGSEKQPSALPTRPASGRGGYEDLVSQLLGGGPPPLPTVEVDDEEEVWIDDEPSPPPRPLSRKPEPASRVIEEMPAPQPADPDLLPPSEWAKPRKAVSLEDRIFNNRRLSTGAKMVLASEILRRPGSPRF